MRKHYCSITTPGRTVHYQGAKTMLTIDYHTIVTWNNETDVQLHGNPASPLWKNRNVVYPIYSWAAFLWGDPDPDRWFKICLDHGASKTPVNPCPEWIRRFLWCTWSRQILDHWPGSGSPQRNAALVFGHRSLITNIKQTAVINILKTCILWTWRFVC